MREDVVTPVTARRLVAEGLVWEPQVSDWCTVLGAEHVSEAPVGLWLVVGVYAAAGTHEQSSTLGLADAQGRWPVAQVQGFEMLPPQWPPRPETHAPPASAAQVPSCRTGWSWYPLGKPL